MKFQTHGLDIEGHPDNVIAFPGAHRCRIAVNADIAPPSSRLNKPSSAVTGAALNARLLILLGICTTVSAIVLSTIHILQGT